MRSLTSADNDCFHMQRRVIDSDAIDREQQHHEHAVLLVERGTLKYHINGSTRSLGEGALVFFRPRDRYQCRQSGASPCRISTVSFQKAIAQHLGTRYQSDLAGRFFWSDDQLPVCYQLNGPRFERAINTFAELQVSQTTLSRIEQFLLYIMTRIVDYSHGIAVDCPNWLLAACEAARSPDVFRGGAAGFVEAAGRGHEHVCRVTRQYLGVTPTAFVNRLRMEHAAMMLGSSDQSIADIAQDCGFENLGHFYKQFRLVVTGHLKALRSLG